MIHDAQDVEGDRMLLEREVLHNRLRCLLLDSKEKDKVYVSLHVGTGYGDRIIANNSKLTWVGSGTTNMMMNIRKEKIKAKFPDLEVHSIVTMDTATMLVAIPAPHLEDVMEHFLSSMLTEKINEEEFEEQKAVSQHQFTENLKNISFRAMMEIQKFAMPNRLYSVPLIKQDLKEVQFGDVEILQQAFFHPDNIVLVICGDMENPQWRSTLQQRHISFHQDHSTARHVYKRNADTMDQKLELQAEESYNIGAIVFRSQHVNFTLEEELLFLHVIGASILPQGYQIEVSADHASVIYHATHDKWYKQALRTTIWSNNKFEQAKRKAFKQYHYLKENDANKFSFLLGQLAVKNVDLHRLLDMEETLSFARFRSYIDVIKESMAETKIHYSNGGGRK